MNEIKLLDAVTIDQIAAGEVVERPASVVKELVENAIDAEASAVTVEIREGGMQLIRITDDGTGIEPSQIPLAFCRHSTSKIRSISDLLSVSSLGFRGEALSSIASVARVELLTKTSEEMAGCRYVIEGGRELDRSAAGLPEGTTIFVRNLFYNTPARRKFLKTPAGEAGQIQELMIRFALSHPEVAFTYIQQGQTKFSTSGNGKLQEVIYGLLGKDMAKEVIPVSYECEAFLVDGFIGTPQVGRGNRNFEFYFVNGRAIRSKIMAGAIEDGYQGQLMQHRYPFVVLSFTVPSDSIDVNVHPAKMDVRFHQKECIYRELSELIKRTLLGRQQVGGFREDESEKAKGQTADSGETAKPGHAAEPFEKALRREQEQRRAKETPVFAEETKPPVQREDGMPGSFQELFQRTRPQANVSEESMRYQAEMTEQISFTDALPGEQGKIYLRMVGQVFGTYWIVEYEQQLLLIDQHAAHEKVLYEQMMERMREKETLSQQISPPILVTLSASDALKLDKYAPYLERMGFETEPFGGSEYAVTAVPVDLYGLGGRELFLGLLEGLDAETGRKNEEAIYERIAAMSCKAAVKGKHRFSEAEAKYLFERLLRLKDPYHCPHGRPTMITVYERELEKKFRRVL